MQRMRGITAIGMLAVLIVLGVLGYVYVTRFMGPSKEESTAKLSSDFQALYSALDQYRLDNGNYPTTEQGLDALIKQPEQSPIPKFWKQDGYVVNIPLDPWGRSYQYVNNYEVVRVYSYGSRGKDGGTDIDVSNVNN
jgi:general secretion pathway protein G